MDWHHNRNALMVVFIVTFDTLAICKRGGAGLHGLTKRRVWSQRFDLPSIAGVGQPTVGRTVIAARFASFHRDRVALRKAHSLIIRAEIDCNLTLFSTLQIPVLDTIRRIELFVDNAIIRKRNCCSAGGTINIADEVIGTRRDTVNSRRWVVALTGTIVKVTLLQRRAF